MKRRNEEKPGGAPPRGGWLIRTVVVGMLIAAMAAITIGPASASSTLGRVAAVEGSVSAPAALEVARAGGPESCAGVVAAVSGNVYAWVAAAVSAPYCGAWLGGLNASAICWGSRQWWGAYNRFQVWVITGGKYTRC